MKKSLFLLLITSMFLITSCESEPGISTYQVSNESNFSKSSYDGTLFDVVVFCYAGNDIVREDNYEQITTGEKTAIKDVSAEITKIKVSFKFLPKTSIYYNTDLNPRKYVASYTLIQSGKNVVATVKTESTLE